MKIRLRAVEKTDPSKEKRRAEKNRFRSCRNADERKAMVKAERFNRKTVSGGSAF